MAEKEGSSTSSKRSEISNGSGGSARGAADELEGATGTGVPMRKKSKKRREKKSSKVNSKSRKDDVPACETVEKVSMKSGNETSQSEWLNEIVPQPPAPSRWQSIVGFIDNYKYPIMASVVLAGVLVYVSVRKTRMATRCPFTGKKSA
ncbi:hypothetical protein CAEBREN_22712 [Caenorhabditis brenneri]|uniref:Uncharacterized protein n=1 Tax=Caenorhabditis brenneri TaxID=135651 RepID=G0N3G3_CAEBE|nr:hypothetical protein CAEBREN_22712 [Caenorhabditis brenneri]